MIKREFRLGPTILNSIIIDTEQCSTHFNGMKGQDIWSVVQGLSIDQFTDCYDTEMDVYRVHIQFSFPQSHLDKTTARWLIHIFSINFIINSILPEV